MNLSDSIDLAALAIDIQTTATAQGVGPVQAQPAPIDTGNAIYRVSMYDLLIDQPELRETTRDLFANEHYALAVEEAFKCINNLVKRRTSESADGAGLMTRAFSIDKPLMRLNALNTQSQRDQQQGYMLMLARAMTGVRNPRAHEHRYFDESQIALELLVFANHLMRMVVSATRTRNRSK